MSSEVASPGDDPALRASQVFEAWLVREGQGKGEPFEELLGEHPDLRKSLERLRRMNAILQDTIQAALPGDRLPEQDRSRTLGDYRIVREIARGAMGIVFEAEQISLRRRVALKVLPAQLTLNERALARFQREAEISAKLNHRNIISIHQVGEVAGVHFIVMELVEGTSLDRVIERMRRESHAHGRRPQVGDVVSVEGIDERPVGGIGSPPAEGRKGSSSASNKNYIETAVRLVCQVADALEHAHRAGVIHRDVKPSNILVRTDGTPVLTDFGLAREEGLPALSATGDFAGTPHYVSPEQAMSGRMAVDHRADVFSLGATLYELLTLELPFPGQTIHEVLQRIVTKQPRDPAKLNAALAPDLVTIVLKALEKDPDRRYPGAAAMAEDLRAFIEYRPIQARRTPTVVRALRWLRREPLKAGLAVLVVVGVPLVGTLARSAYESNRLLAASQDAVSEQTLRQAFLDLGLGRDEDAEAGFRESLRHASTDPEALAGLVCALLNQQRSAEALAEIEAHEALPGFAGVCHRLRIDALRMEGREAEAGGLEATLRDPESAVEEYVEALRLLRGTSFDRQGGSTGPALGTRDTMLERRERARQAVQWLIRANQGSERAAYAFSLAGAAWIAEDEEQARLIATTIARNWPDEALAWFHVGLAREVFDLAGALEAYARASEQSPELVVARQRSAILLLELEPAKGLERLKEVVEARPEKAENHANLAAAHYALGRYPEAVEAAQLALELEPGMVAALDTLGTARIRLGDVAGACEPLRRALELEPNGARLHNDLGWALWQLGEKEEARSHLQRALELDPEFPLPLLNLGIDAWAEESYRSALSYFQQAIARNDAHPAADFQEDQAWMGIGDCLAQLERPEEALEAFEEAHRLAPGDASHALNLGVTLRALGRHAEAVGPLEEALARGTGDESEHECLVDSRLQLGDRAGALAAARRWSDRFPGSAKAWNWCAWIQVDPDGDPALRAPADALEAAQNAARLTRHQDAAILDTLAWALLWSGREEEAQELGRRAVARAQEALDDPLAADLGRSLARLSELAASAR